MCFAIVRDFRVTGIALEADETLVRSVGIKVSLYSFFPLKGY